jgi:DinB superfamily
MNKMPLNLEAFSTGKITFAELVRDISHADLYTLTDEYFATVESIVASATDADLAFVPHDPAAQDPNEQGWTLPNVITHFTSSCEESAAAAAMLARGVLVESRLRYEVPWETLQHAQQLHDRLTESRRICRAFLDAWPDAPHLDLTITRIPRFGPMNAIGLHILGLLHLSSHLDQLRETMRQAKSVKL